MSRVRWFFLFTFLLVVILFALVPKVVPDIRERMTLSSCLIAPSDNAKRECAFSVMRTALEEKGAAEALQIFATANNMFQRLDIDCHAGAHRVGDMMYYSIYIANRFDISPDDFPPEALICDLGFYHGVFEHLFQDYTDPKFISDTCYRFPLNGNARMEAVRYTCFHAAGHGLLRAQSEKVSRKDWGNPRAFVTAPVAECNALPHTSEQERFDCITGVESIFMQTSMQNEYGLSDPDNGNGYTICNQLDVTLHPTCYFVRSLMMSQMSNSYVPVIKNCSETSEPLFRECVRGAIAGLAVNGFHEESLKRSIKLCFRPEMLERNYMNECFRQVISEIERGYLGTYIPQCELFPEKFRAACRQASL